MEWLSRLLAGRTAKRASPDRVSTDEVLPVYFFDDTPMLRNAIMCWTMRFNDVLDPDKLHQSLEGLLRRDDGWRKLRGRIRLDAVNSKRLVIHVPPASDLDRPAVTFSQVAFQVGIDEHPEASQLPRPTASPSLQANHGGEVAIAFGLGPAAPRTMDEFLTTDAPQLSLHVVSFADATLVSLTWPHIASDGMGMGELVRAWSSVLAGRDDEVPPMLAAGHDDPLRMAGQHPDFQEKHLLEERHMRGWRMMIWGLRYLVDMIWWPRMRKRAVFIPRQAVAKLRADAMASLEARHSAEGVGSDVSAPPYVSAGDVVTAWISRMAAQELSASSTRSVVVMVPIDMRDRMPSVFPPREDGGVYVLNAAPILSCIVDAREMRSEAHGLGATAHAIRETLTTQTSEAQIHALNRLERVSIAENGLPALFGDMGSFLIITTNMTRARFIEKLDFAPAVIPGAQDRSQALNKRWHGPSEPPAAPGRMVHYQMQGLGDDSVSTRNNFFIFGTPAGDYWINGSLPPAIWTKIEVAFSTMMDGDCE